MVKFLRLQSSFGVAEHAFGEGKLRGQVIGGFEYGLGLHESRALTYEAQRFRSCLTLNELNFLAIACSSALQMTVLLGSPQK